MLEQQLAKAQEGRQTLEKQLAKRQEIRQEQRYMRVDAPEFLPSVRADAPELSVRADTPELPPGAPMVNDAARWRLPEPSSDSVLAGALREAQRQVQAQEMVGLVDRAV